LGRNAAAGRCGGSPDVQPAIITRDRHELNRGPLGFGAISSGTGENARTWGNERPHRVGGRGMKDRGRSSSYPPAGQRFRGGFPCAEEVSAVGLQIAMLVHASGGPADLDRVDPAAGPEPEVGPAVAGRLVAAAADSGRDLGAPAGPDRDPGPDPVAIR